MTTTDAPRITPEEVAQAYQATGLTPHRGQTIPGKTGHCCGLGALYIATHRDDYEPNENSVFKYADERYGREYVAGFWRGFDHMINLATTEEFCHGYADGQAAAEAVFG